MKLLLVLCTSLICLLVCSSANAQASKPAADTPDPAQVQQVLALLNNWPDTCSDQLARMAQVDQFSTPVIRAAIEQFHPTVVQLSSLTPISSGVSGMQYKEYEIPGYDGGRPFRVSGALTELTIDGAEHEYVACCLGRYLFDVPDEVPITDRTFKNGFESDWFYNAPEKTLPSKAGVIDTLWPLKKDGSGRLTFIWPGSYRSHNNFRQWAEIKVGNGGILMGSGPGATAEQYVAAFDYCSEHYSRRNTNSLSPQDTLAQDSLQTSRTAAQGEAPARTDARPAWGAPRHRVDPTSINQEIAREQGTRISFGFPFVESACMSSDGKYVAYVRNDHLVFVWSLHPLRLVDRYTLYDPGVPGAIPNLYRHITFLRRGRVLALLFSDGSIDLVSARDGHVIKQDTQWSNPDTVLTQFLRRPNRIARLTSDGGLRETSITGLSEKHWRVPGGKVLGAAMSQDGSALATEGPGERIRIFNTRTHRLLVSDNGMLEFYCLWNTFSDNGSLFACMGRAAETLATWSTKDDRFKSIKARWFIQQVAVSANGHYIAVAEPGTVELLSLSRNRQIRRLSSSAIKVFQVGGNVTCLQFASSNRTLLVGLEGGDVTLWDFLSRSHVLLEAK